MPDVFSGVGVRAMRMRHHEGCDAAADVFEEAPMGHNGGVCTYNAKGGDDGQLAYSSMAKCRWYGARDQQVLVDHLSEVLGSTFTGPHPEVRTHFRACHQVATLNIDVTVSIM